MTAGSNRWLMKGSERKLVPAEPEAVAPGPDEVLVEIDACSLWHSNVGFAYGGAHQSASATPQPRVSGHVVEAGDNALFYIDREVVLPATVPCGQQDLCWVGGVLTCPNKTVDGACAHGTAASIVAPAREVNLAEKHKSTPIGPGLTPFKDG